jgi:hypothetical protein
MLVAGAVLAFVVGSDSAFSSGSRRLTSTGSVIATADRALDHSGPTVTVTVSTPDDRPVFVGLGNAVDVDDYLADAAQTRVESFPLRGDIKTTAVDGASAPAADPRDLDWWLVQGAGKGSAEIDFPLPDDEVVDVVVMDPDRGHDFVADVEVGVEIPGLFAGAIAASAFGLGLVLAGVLALRRRSRSSRTREQPVADSTADVGAS